MRDHVCFFVAVTRGVFCRLKILVKGLILTKKTVGRRYTSCKKSAVSEKYLWRGNEVDCKDEDAGRGKKGVGSVGVWQEKASDLCRLFQGVGENNGWQFCYIRG